MKKYDYEKARALILARESELKCVSLGMWEDWWWTATTVWEGGVFLVDLENPELELAGITGSSWATPSIELERRDGICSAHPCFIDDGKPKDKEKEQMTLSSFGTLSSAAQAERPPLEDLCN